MYPYKEEGYLKPMFPYIGSIPETEKYLATETKMLESISKTAKAFQKLYKDKNVYQNVWKEALPEVLGQVLEGNERKASELAAIAFLERKGYTITKESV